MSLEAYGVPSQEVLSAAEFTDDILAVAERRVEKIKKMVTLSLRATHSGDWVNMQGKPYLMGSGAEKIARLWGVKTRNIKVEKIQTEDEKGKFYYYMVTGECELPGGNDSLIGVGTCSMKDQFFSSVTVDGEKILKPISEIDETNIMKSAYTNFLTNGITRLLGIRNLTFEQLRAGGVDVEKIGAVEYRGREMGDGAKGKRDECWSKLLEMSDGEEKSARARLKSMTSWVKPDGTMVAGKDNINALSEKQIDYLYSKLDKSPPKKSESMAAPPNGKTTMLTIIQSAGSLDLLEVNWTDFQPEIRKLPAADRKELQEAYDTKKHALAGK